MQNKVQCIKHQWVVGEGRAFEKTDPTKGQQVWYGAAASAEQVDQAVAAAQQQLRSWMQTQFKQRLNICRQFATLVGEYKTILAHTISSETGKPIWEAETEVAAVIGKIEISRRAYHQRTGNSRQQIGANQASLTHKARGVCAVLGPFNFPAHLPNGHIVPALLAGNTIVFKPSEQAPKTADLMLRLWIKAGLPAGVINLVQGDKSTSQTLVQHPDVVGVFFTGSSQTGIAIQRACLDYPYKVLALEMGGNNPLVVDSDVDINAAVYHIIQSAYITAGQRCTCARRLLLPSDNAFSQQLIDALVAQLKQLKVAHYDAKPAGFYGSVVSVNAANQLLMSQQNLVNAGAKQLLTMQHIEPETGLLSPGLLDVSQVSSADMPDEEDFGPLLKVQFYQDFDHAIQLANQTRYGLSAGLLSNDSRKFKLFLQLSRAGIVNWNLPTTGASGSAPFGGVGLSGNARPSAFYAADYCAYPVASMQAKQLVLPAQLPQGYKQINLS
ncbi:succinylglutamic semialdehyde dehydrogenase [Catenovulum agarivorans DS-2]|uniref:Succinylglutamic semialdehyde dehydrogenase n=1 Tax=Catenovulum agarivorans DS-2 TaxID=1328313 RepID=W7QSE6_9ALTE|nr:succinylglutamate-semialdehyde dehydrogenase [Catenovulum agarivorans]EWH11947.1 succinylglutamic semialdehyde dehydrogenase [Catenovulum agarivorans DS-2]